MAEIIFVTGGCRSGKSTFARKLGESLPGPRVFLATCPPKLDEEMSLRIDKHRAERALEVWDTVEEPVRLDSVLSGPGPKRVFLVDCLSLWVNNLLYEAAQKGSVLNETDVDERCRDVLSACAPHTYTLILVSNEVGMGIVPGNDTARLYRDLLGRANQVMAEAARKVVLMVSGIPVRIKE